MAVRIRHPIARRQAIQREMTIRGVLSVSELCDLLGASPATIRRDLASMEAEGVIRRKYGGAILRDDNLAAQRFEEQHKKDTEAKRRLASATMKCIEPGQTIFISDGSTMLELAREMLASRMELFVATQAINIAQLLATSDKITVCLLGGFVRPSSFATCGPFAERMVKQINADWLFLSSTGFDIVGGLSYEDPNDLALARMMISQSKHVAAVITHAKFSIRAPMTGVEINELHLLVTQQMSFENRQALQNASIELIEVDV